MITLTFYNHEFATIVVLTCQQHTLINDNNNDSNTKLPKFGYYNIRCTKFWILNNIRDHISRTTP